MKAFLAMVTNCVAEARRNLAAKLKGVISNVPLEITEEEIKKEIKGGKLIDVKRLQTNKDGVKKDSLPMMVQFESTLPQEVKMGG